MRRLPGGPATLCLLLLGWIVPAASADGFLGEAWETGIAQGIERQERERKQRPPETLLRQAKLLAARPAEGATRVVRVYLLARAYGIAGDVPAARDTYRDVLARAPRCYFAHHDLAMLALGTEPPDDRTAEHHLRQAIGLNPAYLTGHRKLAMLLLRLERPGEALSFLERIVDIDPADTQARFLLARVLLDLGRLDAAEREVTLLRRREPTNQGFEALHAQILVKRGQFQEARRLYRALASRSPGAAEPLLAYLRIIELEREQTQEMDAEGYLWALEGLLRLERDPERRAELSRAMEDIRRHEAGASLPDEQEGPPSDARVTARLPDLTPDQRVEVMRYVYARKDAPSGELLTAIIRLLSPTTEPDPRVRGWALRILGRFGGFGLVGLVRHSLGDPGPEVRPIAADALVDLAQTGKVAHGAVLLVLGLHVNSPDPALATAAQAGVVNLAGATLAEPSADTLAARRAVFQDWWQGTGGGEARIEALGRFPEIADREPEAVLIPYLGDRDPFAFLAAWQAMAKERDRLVRDPALEARRRVWLNALPPVPPNAEAAQDRTAIRRWIAARPR